MTRPDVYLLGRSLAEEERLKRQIADLPRTPTSSSKRSASDPARGSSIWDAVLAASCISWENTSARPGRFSGSTAALILSNSARRFAADLGLTQVEVREGDAYDTGLPRASFDGAHARLVLVTVPKPELIVRELVSLVRPGGWVASFEADFVAHNALASPEYSRLLAAFQAHAQAQGIDLYLGRRTHRLFREAGLTDINVDAVVHVYPVGHSLQLIFRDFVNNVREKLIDGGFISRDELERDLHLFEEKLADPEVLLISHLFFRLWGRVPAGNVN